MINWDIMIFLIMVFLIAANSVIEYKINYISEQLKTIRQNQLDYAEAYKHAEQNIKQDGYNNDEANT